MTCTDTPLARRLAAPRTAPTLTNVKSWLRHRITETERDTIANADTRAAAIAAYHDALALCDLAVTPAPRLNVDPR